MTNSKRSRTMLIGSMVIFGTIGIFVRNIPLASSELALYRSAMAVVLFGVYLLLRKEAIPFSKIKKDLPLVIISGFALGFNWIFLFEAYKYTSVSTATLSYYFAPVIVIGLCPVIFHEKLTKKQILCFIMSTLGIVMITGVDSISGGQELVGILFGLSAAVFYAAVILLNKCVRNVQPIHRTFLQFAAAFLTLLPYVFITNGFHLNTLRPSGLINLVIIGLVHTGLAYYLYFSSLKELPGQTSAILSYIDPLVAVILSVTVLGESLSIWQFLGGALILGFTLLNEISTQK